MHLNKLLNRKDIYYGDPSVDIAGKIINNIEIIQYIGSTKKDWRSWWLCKCHCGTEFVSTYICLNRGDTKSCGCLKTSKHNSLSHRWTGYGEISGAYICHIKCRAKRLGIDFSVSIKYLWEVFQKQNKKCSLTGQDISMKSRNNPGTASLDRIDSSKGYIEGNVQWVHKDINRMKMDLSQEIFISMCNMVANYMCT